MRVAVMTAGPRGDGAPYTGLGHGVARAGHEVTLVTHSRCEPLARSAGLGFHTLLMDSYAELRSERGDRARSLASRLAAEDGVAPVDAAAATR
ncbi:glycosyltransferase [Streptomyces sp. PR69]|uniref:glycosyltransferase n=1 Tax=Streptomyces sp. PR69 TaxID=2984950 RepID=UPI002B269ADA|nr:glycosyltransferase [Streptomyces sp. PR69]